MLLRLSRLALVYGTVLVVFLPCVRGRPAPDQSANQALREAIQQFHMVQAQIGSEVLKADAKVQSKVSEVPTILVPVQPEPQLVNPDQKVFLLGKIRTFAEHVKSNEILYTSWALGLVIAAAILALGGAILSFARRHVIAGIASLIVTAIIGFSNVYPLNALSDFYRGLEAQTSALQVECELKQPFTVDSYNSEANQLQLLYLYEGSKRPSLGNYKVPLQNLTNELQTVKISSANVEKTKAVVATTPGR